MCRRASYFSLRLPLPLLTQLPTHQQAFRYLAHPPTSAHPASNASPRSTGLRHVWFLRGAEQGFVIQLALQLTPMVFAPGELAAAGYLYIVHRGLALYGGMVLTFGKVRRSA